MPVNTKVHELYLKLRAKGHTTESAARIAQAVTGLSLVTGQPPRGNRKRRGKKS